MQDRDAEHHTTQPRSVAEQGGVPVLHGAAGQLRVTP